MPKNIVICCDGTGNEFGAVNSNVVRLYRVLEANPQTQVVYYHPGVGTLGAPNALTKLQKWWTRMCGLAFGYGLSAVVADACKFLMDHFEEGDRVYLFGFSRGAYAVRALAALLYVFGLIRKGNEVLIPYAIRMLKHRPKNAPADGDAFAEWQALGRQFRETFSRECKPHFVGLWDTVSSVGWIYSPVTLPFTAANPDIHIGRHAVSIDERRCFYRQNLWSAPAPGQDIRQVWFAGVHSDVGRGYAEAESGLAGIALDWMLDQAVEAGLLVNATRSAEILAAMGPPRSPHKSLHGAWWILEYWPKRYVDLRRRPPVRRWMLPRGRPRYIPQDAEIHPSVFELMRDLRPPYRPPNLPVGRPSGGK
jgi:uncharacterized protein (DUF2235 family)